MLFLDLLAEQNIAAAIACGELTGLPVSASRWIYQRACWVPAELRMVNRILRNAGLLPPELECLREIGQIERLLDALAEGSQRSLLARKLQLLRLRRDESRQPRPARPIGGNYSRRILDRLG